MRLWLVLNVQAAFESFWSFESSLHFFRYPEGGAWAAHTHPASGLRLFEQKPRACVPHAPYVGIGGFMRATACFIDQ